jgi:L-histidine N-alpha-methyltransferase
MMETTNELAMTAKGHGDTPLLTASRRGQLEVLRTLLAEHGVPLEHTNTDGKTALHEAAQEGHVDCVRLLLGSGAQVDSLKKADWTPLMLACTKENLAVVEELVKNGASLSLVNKDGWTPFHIACREGHTFIIKFLLDSDPGCWDTRSKNGRTPLHTAALHGRLEVVQLLLQRCDYEADPRDTSGVTPLMDAAHGGHVKVLQSLLQHNKGSLEAEDLQGRRAVHHAAQAGDNSNSALSLLQREGASIEAVIVNTGQTPLHCAAREGQAGTISTLLSLGADPKLTDKTGKTALDVARQARNGAEAVKVLEKVRIVNGAKHGLNGEELPRTTISHLSQPQDFKAELKQDVRLSLAVRSKSIPPKYHYDETGSVLFEEITQLPEYYLTRVETGILRERAGDIMKLVKPDELVELGSGSSTKTRLLLEAMQGTGGRWYVPIEISETALYQAAKMLSSDYDWLHIDGYVGNYTTDLPLLQRRGRRLLTFLGSGLGNYTNETRAEFLAMLGNALQPGDALLLGIDLVKDEETMVLAYNDSAGISARFNLNVLVMLNRELGADFDVSNFTHSPVWNAENSGVESHIRANKGMTVSLPGLGTSIELGEGEGIFPAISCKFTREGVTRELGDVGLEVTQWYTDSAAMYGVLVAAPKN